MSDLEFIAGTPPTATKGRESGVKWDDTVAKLQADPGHWAVVKRGESHSELAGANYSLKARGCEVTRRKLSDDEFVLYARWPEDAA